MCIIKNVVLKQLSAKSLDGGLLNVSLNILNANAFLVKCDSLALRKADTGNLPAPYPSHPFALPRQAPANRAKPAAGK